MELAKVFFRSRRPAVPDSLLAAFATRPETAAFSATFGYPELKTPLPPQGTSGPRNHDLWLVGECDGVPASIGIEAKADEDFQEKIGAKHSNAVKQRAAGSNTQQARRIDILGELLFGASFSASADEFCDLRYQLFSGLAGTVLQAVSDRAEVAVFLVYEFETSKTAASKLARNQREYRAFVDRLLAIHSNATAGVLAGPFYFESADVPNPVPLYVGKVREVL